MGGTWLSGDPAFHPLVWRERFPASIQSELVSTSNPRGRITNSDLELTGQLAHLDVLTQHNDCRERTVSTLTDNISARSWQRKGSTTTLGLPPTYCAYKHYTSATTVISTNRTTSQDRRTLWPTMHPGSGTSLTPPFCPI